MRKNRSSCRIRSYRVWLDFDENKDDSRIINARSIGEAKSKYFSAVADCLTGLKFTQVRAKLFSRRLKGPIITERFRHIADYRGIPFARPGQIAKWRDDFIQLVDGCSSGSALLSALFLTGRHAHEILSVHPGEIVICVTGTASRVLRKPKYYETPHIEVENA